MVEANNDTRAQISAADERAPGSEIRVKLNGRAPQDCVTELMPTFNADLALLGDGHAITTSFYAESDEIGMKIIKIPVMPPSEAVEKTETTQAAPAEPVQSPEAPQAAAQPADVPPADSPLPEASAPAGDGSASPDPVGDAPKDETVAATTDVAEGASTAAPVPPEVAVALTTGVEPAAQSDAVSAEKSEAASAPAEAPAVPGASLRAEYPLTHAEAIALMRAGHKLAHFALHSQNVPEGAVANSAWSTIRRIDGVECIVFPARDLEVNADPRLDGWKVVE